MNRAKRILSLGLMVSIIGTSPKLALAAPGAQAEKAKWALRWSFEADTVGGLPAGWKLREGSPNKVYQIEVDERGNHYLAARSRGSGVQLGVSVKVQASLYSVLSWRWRVLELPRGADERKLDTMDSAAAVYVVFGSELFPRILKYVWSSTVPVGTVLSHPHSGRVAIFVIATNDQGLGQWAIVSRNVVEDYRRAFGAEPGTIVAIGVKTDSDSTSSSASADYDDLMLAPSPGTMKGEQQ